LTRDSCPQAEPLRRATDALVKYHDLRETGIQHKRDMTVLKREIRETEESVKAEKDRFVAVEMNLVARANELQT
jgi:hypothetical protein